MKKALVIDKKNIIEIIEVDNSKIIGYTLIEVNNQSKISNTYSGVVKKITKNGFCFIDIGLDDMCFIDLNKSKNSLKHGDKLNVIVIKDKTLVKKMQVKQTEIIHNNTSEIEKKIQELEKNLYEIIRGDETLVTDNFITKELDNIYAKKIWLKCGGYILIEECETATLIDVNSGKNIKSKTTEELAIKTNQEACEIITKQLKLRNIAGIILIDFINTDKNSENELIASMKSNEYKIHGFTKLGIMEITKKRTSNSVKQITDLINNSN